VVASDASEKYRNVEFEGFQRGFICEALAENVRPWSYFFGGKFS
jgi:hypothetical protein